MPISNLGENRDKPSDSTEAQFLAVEKDSASAPATFASEMQPQLFNCPSSECDLTFTDLQELIAHKLACNHFQSLYCVLCDQYFETFYELSSHLEVEHGNTSFSFPAPVKGEARQ